MSEEQAEKSFRLESVEAIMKLPVVEAAFVQGASMYDRVKGINYMVKWALTTAESTVQLALDSALPLASRLDEPIHSVDQSLVRGIQTLRLKAPIVDKQPRQIYDEALSAVIGAKDRTALTLKELSWNKANELLNTGCGQMAVSRVDSVSGVIDSLIDSYFPLPEGESPEDVDAPVSAEEDAALHTVQTVGRLSNKAARRLYASVTNQLNSLSANDVKEYVSSLVAVLQLTRILNMSQKPNEMQK